MTPAEFLPYIEARIEAQKQHNDIENNRIGLICAIIQNGVPTGYIKKGAKIHQPHDYFKHQEKPENTMNQTERTFAAMNAWVEATGRR